MTTPTWASHSIDTQVALRTAAARLAEEFRGIYGAETIERFLSSSYDQLAASAAITKFLPLMAERFGRQRLRALAKVEGLHNDGKPAVLVSLHPQRRPIPDGYGLLRGDRWGPGGRLVRRLRTGPGDQPVGDRGDG